MVARTDTVLSLTGIRGGGTTDDWDFHPDGDRFVVTRMASPTGSGRDPDPSRILVVMNWFDEFRKLRDWGS